MHKLVLLALLTTACVTAKVTRLGMSPTDYAPISPDEVTVLADISELEADTIRYERIAIINMSGSGGGWTDQDDMLKKARQEAAKLGANAVIISGYTQGDYNAFWGSSSQNEGSAMAIRYWFVSKP